MSDDTNAVSTLKKKGAKLASDAPPPNSQVKDGSERAPATLVVKKKGADAAAQRSTTTRNSSAFLQSVDFDNGSRCIQVEGDKFMDNNDSLAGPFLDPDSARAVFRGTNNNESPVVLLANNDNKNKLSVDNCHAFLGRNSLANSLTPIPLTTEHDTTGMFQAFDDYGALEATMKDCYAYSDAAGVLLADEAMLSIEPIPYSYLVAGAAVEPDGGPIDFDFDVRGQGVDVVPNCDTQVVGASEHPDAPILDAAAPSVAVDDEDQVQEQAPVKAPSSDVGKRPPTPVARKAPPKTRAATAAAKKKKLVETSAAAESRLVQKPAGKKRMKPFKAAAREPRSNKRTKPFMPAVQEPISKKRKKGGVVGPSSTEMIAIERMIIYVEETSADDPKLIDTFHNVVKRCKSGHANGQDSYKHLPGSIFEALVQKVGGQVFGDVYKASRKFEHARVNALYAKKEEPVSLKPRPCPFNQLVDDSTIGMPSLLQAAVGYGFHLSRMAMLDQSDVPCDDMQEMMESGAEKILQMKDVDRLLFYKYMIDSPLIKEHLAGNFLGKKKKNDD